MELLIDLGACDAQAMIEHAGDDPWRLDLPRPWDAEPAAAGKHAEVVDVVS